MTQLKIYLVGGAVRDRLLGLESKDRDWVVVGASPEQMIDNGYKQVGKDFPVFLHPDTGEEYALARTERKTGEGYTGFQTYHAPDVTLEEDLERRDLTINAMAMDAEGQVIDPYGGQEDLKNKRLRHVSSAFNEDPLRVLRLARFYARLYPQGFRVCAETISACQSIRDAGELAHLTPERVWQETYRALHESHASEYFRFLRDIACLDHLIPELDALFGVPQTATYHPEIDTGVHVLMVLDQAKRLSSDPEVWYAALMHDLGKALTPESILPSHHGHEKTGLKPLKAVNRALKVPKHFADLALLCCEFHTHVHRAAELRPETVLKVLQRCDAFRRPERFMQLLLCCEADARGRTNFEESPYPQRARFESYMKAARSVNVSDLLEKGLKGAELGDAINQERSLAIKAVKQELDH